MGRFPKYKRVRLDILKSCAMQPFGAFVQGGKITTGWKGFNDLEPAVKGINAMCMSEVGRGILAATGDGKIYTGSTLGTKLELKYSDGGSTAFAFETRDSASRAVLISGNTFTTLISGNMVHGVFPVRLFCGTMRCGRLFGGDVGNPYILRWSGPGGFGDWDEGISGAGRLILEPSGGRILDIFNFEDELVVFREQSIMLFSIYGNPENFKEKATVITPRIYPHTATILGDSIIFFSSAGLMKYRGGRIEKIDEDAFDDLTLPTSAFAYDGRYYFICGTSKTLSKTVVFTYDFLCGGYGIINIPAYFISRDDTSVLGYGSSTIYRMIFGYEYMQYEVTADKVNFGTNKRKLLMDIEVDCDPDVRVSISNGRSTKSFRANGKTRLNIRGAEFRIIFYGYGGSVRSAYATVEVVE